MKTLRIFAFLLAVTGPAYLVNAQNAGQAGGAGAGGAGGSQTGAGQAGAGQAGTGQTGVPGQPAAGQLPGQNPGVNQGMMQWNPYNEHPWFNNPQMAELLRLHPEILHKLSGSYQQNYQKYQESLNGLPNNLAEEELANRRQALAQQFENNFTGSLDKSIPDQTQRQRFQQLMTQYQGLNAFDNPSILQRLNLSAEQRRQINRMQQEWRRTMMRLSRANGNMKDFDWNDFYRRSNLSVDEILTPEQLQIWKEIRGESVNLPADVYFRTRPDGNTAPGNTPGNIPEGVIQGNAPAAGNSNGQSIK